MFLSKLFAYPVASEGKNLPRTVSQRLVIMRLGDNLNAARCNSVRHRSENDPDYVSPCCTLQASRLLHAAGPHQDHRQVSGQASSAWLWVTGRGVGDCGRPSLEIRKKYVIIWVLRTDM